MSWANRVAFTFEGGLAYRPGEVIVRGLDVKEAARILETRHRWAPSVTGTSAKAAARWPYQPILNGAFAKFEGVPDPLSAIGDLQGSGIYAQVNHVLFATSCCPPHPSLGETAGCGCTCGGGGGTGANPFYANPFYANPFYANPFYANPFYANPFYANPFYANANPGLFPNVRPTGDRESSARPAPMPEGLDREDTEIAVEARVVILDTGYANQQFEPKPDFQPKNLSPASARTDEPDTDGPEDEPDDYLDPVAGHGTFIAGIIEQIAPGCSIEVQKVIEPYGDGDEATIAEAIQNLALRRRKERPHFVNLSFGGYTSMKMEVLAAAVADLHASGVAIVASAGNDATCVPLYPAAFQEVIGVAALAPDGTAARFTNYGPWVSACTYGVNVVSSFFKGFDGANPPIGAHDIDKFDGWARWSGTSFAAPRVVAELVKHWRQAAGSPHEAVKKLIADRVEERHPLLGVRIT